MHRRHRPLYPLLIAGLLFCAVGCKTTTLSTTWKDPSAATLDFKRLVVVVLNSSPGERRAQEDALAASIKRVSVAPSYLSIPDELLRDVPKAKQKIIDGGFDGALILRLVDTRQETTYVPPSVSSSWNDGQGWGYDSYDSHPSYHVSPGYTATETFVRAEISLYAVPSGMLLWSGACVTMNPAEARAFAIDVLNWVCIFLR